MYCISWYLGQNSLLTKRYKKDHIHLSKLSASNAAYTTANSVQENPIFCVCACDIHTNTVIIMQHWLILSALSISWPGNIRHTICTNAPVHTEWHSECTPNTPLCGVYSRDWLRRIVGGCPLCVLSMFWKSPHCSWLCTTHSSPSPSVKCLHPLLIDDEFFQ